jgi:glyoxylase-like metal-dependent hydrolase (beta-lactamase superfamily II)
VISPKALEVPVPGELVEIAPGIRRLTAPNPSLFSGPGTNTYFVGERELVVVDPGPADDGHLDAIAAAGERIGTIRAIAVTHYHIDHAPGVPGLVERAGVRVFGRGGAGGFEPDERIADGHVIDVGDVPLRAVHTPGHASDHLCFLVEEPVRTLLSGDHLMGGSTVVIKPPDGDMVAYLASLERLLVEEPALHAIAPGHGPVLLDPSRVIAEVRSHRLAREASVLAALEARRAATADEIVADVYVDVAEVLHPIARFSVWAHLLKLRGEGRVASDEPDSVEAVWAALPKQD